MCQKWLKSGNGDVTVSLPSDLILTDMVNLSESEHPSQKDSYPHYTTVYQDDDGRHITIKHVYPQ